MSSDDRIDWIRFNWNQTQPVDPNGKLGVKIEKPNKADSIYFTVPTDFTAHSDLVAAALATLCGRKYSRIEFNFPISKKCIELISRGARADVRSSGLVEERQPGENISLNFSGGLDSLATFLLAPEKFRRVSFDFGGEYDRERAWFERLSPDVICATDYRKRRYNKGHESDYWSFFASASVLFADYLGLGSTCFGNVFEVSPKLFGGDGPRQARTDLFLLAAGLTDVTFTWGLTELGTARVLLALGPEFVEDALESVAPPGTEKRFRKELLVDAVRHATGGPEPNFERYEYPATKISLGTIYAVDFLGIYFLKRYGFAIVSRWIEGLEKLDRSLLDKVEVDWFLKFNPWFLPHICPALKADVMANFERVGVALFNDVDWESYRLTRALLAQYHPALSGTPT